MAVNNDNSSESSSNTISNPLNNPYSDDDNGDDDDFKAALQMSMESKEISTDSIIDNICQDKHRKNTVKKIPSNKKCYKCSSKIPIYRRRIVCKCGYVFCAPHSRSDDHNCSFDYKAEYKLLLEKQNNKVVASRCDRI